MGTKMKYRTKTWLITISDSDSLFVSFFSFFMLTAVITCYDNMHVKKR